MEATELLPGCVWSPGKGESIVVRTLGMGIKFERRQLKALVPILGKALGPPYHQAPAILACGNEQVLPLVFLGRQGWGVRGKIDFLCPKCEREFRMGGWSQHRCWQADEP